MIEEAVIKRIKQLCEQKNIKYNDLANISGIPPSTLYSMLSGKSKNPGIVTIKKICDGFNISILNFFDCELFENIEQELF